MAASATFALKPGVWFRRGRLLMVSPDKMGTACPLSGRNSTYRPVQISGTGSTFMINGTPQIVRLPIDPHEHFVQVPAPVRVRMKMNPTLPDLRCKQRTEPVPPEPYRLVADVDATFGQQILDLSQRQGKPDIHHHRKPDDRGRTVEIAEGILHRCKLWNTTSRLKLICSDTALSPDLK